MLLILPPILRRIHPVILLTMVATFMEGLIHRLEGVKTVQTRPTKRKAMVI